MTILFVFKIILLNNYFAHGLPSVLWLLDAGRPWARGSLPGFILII